MKRTLLVVCVAVALVAADDAKTDAKGDKAKLQGTWVATSAERAGQSMGEEFTKGFKLTFKGDRFIVVIGGQEIEGDLKVDEAKKPAEVDFKTDEGTRQGIFSFDGDKLKLCVTEPGGERPKEFSGKADNTLYFVMKKEAAKP